MLEAFNVQFLNVITHHVYPMMPQIVMDRVPEIWIFEFWRRLHEMQVEQGFSSFFTQIFCHKYLMILQNEVH